MKLFSLVLPLVLSFTPAWVYAGEITLQFGSQTIRAEVADTPASREHGLMQRSYLCPNCGMLFVFERADRYMFWMKDTPLPLSIAFISVDGSVINIDEMQAGKPDIHQSSGEARYALEMNRGWFTTNGIRPGFKVMGLGRLSERVLDVQH